MKTPDNPVFSGIQPTGTLHLGNYLGALQEFNRIQNQHECIFCIVDLHAITQQHNPKALLASTHRVAAMFLAAGIDPKQAILFKQSSVRAHTQLAWILNCTARIGWLGRMTQFKEKAGSDRENASVGLYTYPVLMAADILAYKAGYVPVGADQKQHLELARDIAQKFNKDYEEFFPLPEPMTQGTGSRIMSLRDGTSKMSKSDASDASRINLDDSMDTIAKKIRRAKTDSDPLPESENGLAGRPEARNLLTIQAALTQREISEIIAEYSGKPFSYLKNDILESLQSVLAPIQENLTNIEKDPAYVAQILKQGAQRASEISDPIVQQVENLVGLSAG